MRNDGRGERVAQHRSTAGSKGRPERTRTPRNRHPESIRDSRGRADRTQPTPLPSRKIEEVSRDIGRGRACSVKVQVRAPLRTFVFCVQKEMTMKRTLLASVAVMAFATPAFARLRRPLRRQPSSTSPSTTALLAKTKPKTNTTAEGDQRDQLRSARPAPPPSLRRRNRRRTRRRKAISATSCAVLGPAPPPSLRRRNRRERTSALFGSAFAIKRSPRTGGVPAMAAGRGAPTTSASCALRASISARQLDRGEQLGALGDNGETKFASSGVSLPSLTATSRSSSASAQSGGDRNGRRERLTGAPRRKGIALSISSRAALTSPASVAASKRASNGSWMCSATFLSKLVEPYGSRFWAAGLVPRRSRTGGVRGGPRSLAIPTYVQEIPIFRTLGHDQPKAVDACSVSAARCCRQTVQEPWRFALDMLREDSRNCRRAWWPF